MTAPAAPTQKFVAGLIFSPDRQYVALVLKNRPAWQAGKYNAIGGKVEAVDIDTPHAMARECREETGLDIPAVAWEYRLRLLRPAAFDVDFFRVFSPDVFNARTMETEDVHVMPVSEALLKPLIPNLAWIIPLCLDDAVKAPVFVEEV